MAINQSIGTGGGTNNFLAPKKTFIQKLTGGLNTPAQSGFSNLGANSVSATQPSKAFQAPLNASGESVMQKQGQYLQPTALSKIGLGSPLSTTIKSPQTVNPATVSSVGTGGGTSSFAKPFTASPAATNTARDQFINTQATTNTNTFAPTPTPNASVQGFSTSASPAPTLGAGLGGAGTGNAAGPIGGALGGSALAGSSLSSADKAKQDYIEAYKKYNEGQALKLQEAADLESARRLGENNIKDRPIPIEDITGQLASAQRSSSLATQDLSAKQLVDETRAKNSLDAAKFAYELSSGANKNLPASAQEYEYAKQNGYTGTYQQYQTEDANRKAVIAGLTPAQKQQAISQVAGSFDNEPIVKQYNVIAEGKQFVDSIPNTTTNPADQQGLIYAFAKAMDPNSVVREGEYATVQKYAQSWANTFGFSAARIFSNSPFLTPQAIQNMKETINSKFQASKGNYDNVYNEYQRRVQELQSGQVTNPITNYSNAFGNNGNSTAITPTEEAYLQSKGYTPEEINAYKQSFSKVGNTTVSIPQSARLAYVNNNPGNLRFAGQQGAVQGEGGFAKFATPEDGAKALQNQIALDASRGLTLEQFINKYAPPSENNTSQYLAHVIQATNANKNTPLININPQSLLKVIAQRESGTKLA